MTGTPSATVTITTPANGATYVLGEVVNANYSCSGIFSECAGTVTNGTPIDTSSLGTKTFTAEADVTSGPTATASSTYTVVTGAVASLSPTSLNLGNVPVGEFAFRIVTVKNPGTTSLNIASVRVVSVSGGDSDDFFAFSLCPRTLRGGKSCIIIVGFFADEIAVNPQSATLTITYNEAGNPQQLVPLTATVVKRIGTKAHGYRKTLQQIGCGPGFPFDPDPAFLAFSPLGPTVGLGVNCVQIGAFKDCIASGVFLDFVEIPKRVAVMVAASVHGRPGEERSPNE